jgi:hypothetical protein
MQVAVVVEEILLVQRLQLVVVVLVEVPATELQELMQRVVVVVVLELEVIPQMEVPVVQE